ncbi:hypothetical protein ACF0H5_015587 [Mactra antiquata]
MMNRLLVLCSVLISFISPVVEGKLPDIATLCPYNDFCTTKALKTLQPNETDLVPCCQKCSCEHDCQLFGNCCPDKELKPGIKTQFPCVEVGMYYNAPRRITTSSNFHISYHVINECSSIIDIYKYPRCYAPRDLEDFVFVSDPVTDRVYQNKHCAVCNGVQNYTEWLLITNCPLQSESLTRDEWFAYIIKNCEITPIPPDSKAGQAFQCYQPENDHIEKCNVSGDLQAMNMNIKVACEFGNPQINNIFFDTNVFSHMTNFDSFENVYCKLCNTADTEEWSELCDDIVSTSLLSKSTSALSVILNFIKAEEISLKPQCKQGQIWDSFQAACMDVICPVSSMYLEGKCEDMYTQFQVPTEGVYSVYFRIKEGNTMSLVWHGIVNDLHDVVTGMISNDHCVQCQSSVENGINGNIYFKYIMKTTEDCSKASLINLIHTWIRNPHVFFISNIYSNITLIPDLDTSQYGTYTIADPVIVNKCLHPHYLLIGK